MTATRILGVGMGLPKKSLSNFDLPEHLDTSDEWIRERTGIRQRYIVSDGEMTSSLATEAARRALEHAGIDAQEIDMIILGTATPDLTFPSTATKVQNNLNIKHGAAFDLQAACSGFIYGLTLADSLIKSGKMRTALVIGAETVSSILDWNDRNTCVLFGDGAGAVVVQACPSTDDGGILADRIRSDGAYSSILCATGGPSSTKTIGNLHMHGREVFRHAVSKMEQVAREVIADAGIAISDIKWFVPHQANKRILDTIAKTMKIPKERVISTIDRHANTSAASIPLALAEMVREDKLQKGDIVLLTAMGGGLAWGASLLRW